jgi:four helix bundle protein
MQDAKNLVVGEQARALALAIYRHTESFPRSECFGLTSQMRRAAVSIASNIAEGCGRRSNRELLTFLYISAGSAQELGCQLEIATALGFGEPPSAERLSHDLGRVVRMLNRLISFHRAQPAGRRNEGRPR